jgi:hypothetical protein
MNQNKVWKLETEFKSFQQAKSNLGLRNKNMHAWNTILSIYYLGKNALIGKF